MLTIDQILGKADVLAQRCAGDDVPDNLLAMVLSHLRRHRDVASTLSLLAALQRSPFGRRTGSTPQQLAKLRTHVSDALSSKTDWEEAVWIVGWARRLARSHSGARRDGRP